MKSIATLGPVGTCSETVLSQNLYRFGQDVTANLFSTYEQAIESVEQGNSDAALVAAAYPKFNEIAFKRPKTVTIQDSFIFNTPELVIASLGTKQQEIHLLACMSATIPLGLSQFPNCKIIPALSNPDAAKITFARNADACVTTIRACISVGLEVVHSFGSVPMAWVIFRTYV